MPHFPRENATGTPRNRRFLICFAFSRFSVHFLHHSPLSPSHHPPKTMEHYTATPLKPNIGLSKPNLTHFGHKSTQPPPQSAASQARQMKIFYGCPGNSPQKWNFLKISIFFIRFLINGCKSFVPFVVICLVNYVGVNDVLVVVDLLPESDRSFDFCKFRRLLEEGLFGKLWNCGLEWKNLVLDSLNTQKKKNREKERGRRRTQLWKDVLFFLKIESW